ncbi:MAG: hypothetical protein HKO90_07930 [Flavobacteriaceae bacterium]|nr:nuclear transport factor 2 family protein [Bacteroidia bacterium]NNK88198.1 hypothetical protein [Flavobacteriaceae bacterium]
MKTVSTTIALLFFILAIPAQEMEYDKSMITTAIENYFYGYIERDSDKLHKAFDTENGAMKLLNKNETGKEQVNNIKFKELVERWGSREKMSASDLDKCKLDIQNIDIVDSKIASARIRMQLVKTSYIDILSLQKIDGRWKIVNKIFVEEFKQ